MDWFGFDFYPGDMLGVGDSRSWRAADEAYHTSIYPRLSRPDQRVVPTTSANTKTAADDDFCVRNALQWLKLSLADPRIVAILTLTLDGGPALGPSNPSRCSKLYQAMGQMQIAAGAGTDPLDTLALVGPPKPVGGQFVEPTCRSLAANRKPVGGWDWCDRTNDRLWTCLPATKQCVISTVGTFGTLNACETVCNTTVTHTHL